MYLPGFLHDGTLGEQDRAIAIGKAREFILARFAEPVHRPSLLEADRFGFTRDEADELASPLPLASPRGVCMGIDPAGPESWRMVFRWHSPGSPDGVRFRFDSRLRLS